MGLFRKSIRHSKPSKDLDYKIKNLEEELKQTGVVPNEDDSSSFCAKEELVENTFPIVDEIKVIEEETLYNWRESFEDNAEEEVEEVKENNKKIVRVESYISENNRELIEIRDQVFSEISKTTLLNLPEIKEKISRILEIYDELQEGLLNQPPETKNEDPLTPLDQNFVTVDELNKHYNLFINRIQEQIATIGGGGEVRLEFLDDIDRNTAKTDGYFLQYQASTGKFVGAAVTGSSGVVGSAGTWAVDSVGINTIKNVGIGTTAKEGYKLYVEGDVRVTGILTIGQSSITFNGNSNQIQVGTGVTIDGNTGIISAKSLYINGVSIGATGTQGVQGTTGSQGVTGTQGIIGVQGLTGTQGITGSQGLAGTQGTTGSQGITGAGTQGTTGVQGTTGAQGATGGGGSQTLAQTLALGNSSTLGINVGVTTITTLNVTGISTIAVGVVTTLRGSTLSYTGISTFAPGPVLISSTGTATTTGTASQPLQVTGGAYVSGSVGVGTTNPRETLDVIGTIGLQASGATNRFEIQHNTSLNSLDFIFI